MEFGSDVVSKGDYHSLNVTLIHNLRKKIDELKESEKKFRLIFENAGDGILVADAETKKFVFANPQICRLTGYNEKELLRLEVKDIHPKKDLPYVIDQFTKQSQAKLDVAKNIPVLRKDKKIVFCDVNSSPLIMGSKKLLVGFFRDVTEQKLAEGRLRESENKYRTLLENLPQKIFFKDRNSVYISCNENYARDLKIKPDKIVGKTDFNFFPKKLAKKYRADDKRIMKSGKTEDIEEEYVVNGRKVFVHTVKTPVKDEKGNVFGVLGIFWSAPKRKLAKYESKEG